MAANIHVGDVGLRFDLTIRRDDGVGALDISNATVLHLRFQKPSGAVVTQIASFVTDGTDGQLEWTTTSVDDLDESGPWKWQGFAQMADGVRFRSDVLSFDVFANL